MNSKKTTKKIRPLSIGEFETVEALAPFISIDLVIERDGKVLMGRRDNRPARGYWFVPGGIVLKGERLDGALRRIAIKEAGLSLDRSAGEFLGVFEHDYGRRHYIVLAYKFLVDDEVNIQADDQHSEMSWVDSSTSGIHPFARAYLK